MQFLEDLSRDKIFFREADQGRRHDQIKVAYDINVRVSEMSAETGISASQPRRDGRIQSPARKCRETKATIRVTVRDGTNLRQIPINSHLTRLSAKA